jgi:hypothetical protein
MRGSRPLKAGAGTLTNAGKPLGIGEAGTEPNIGMAGCPLSHGGEGWGEGVRSPGGSADAPPSPNPPRRAAMGRGTRRSLVEGPHRDAETRRKGKGGCRIRSGMTG